jgi:4-hydroxy 2-oxovalerate aldolase
VHKTALADSIRLLQDIQKKGYEVSLNAMGIETYTESELRNLVSLVKDSGLDYIYPADSYGALFPDRVEALISPLLEIPDIQVGFHPHNNLQMAFANTLEAIRCGVHIVDSTMFGMGRGAGNLPTEVLLSYLARFRPDKYNAIPVLNCIDLFFVEYERDHPWGYQLPYMISGILGCHPNYAHNLIERRRYTMEEIWKVLEVIQRRDPVGFDVSLVEEAVENGLVGGAQGGPKDSDSGTEKSAVLNSRSTGTVTYKDRHAGRPFLVLGNGPSLSTHQEKIRTFIERYDPVVLGANFLGDLFTPDYHAFSSFKRFVKYAGNVDSTSQLLIGENIETERIREYTALPYETIFFKDVLNAPFGIDDHGVIQTNCRTVSVLLLGVAIVMGAESVFAAGLDGYVDTNDSGEFFFYKEEDEQQERDLIISTHRWCEHHITGVDHYLKERNQDGIHILTPTSYKAFYTGIENYLGAETDRIHTGEGRITARQE